MDKLKKWDKVLVRDNKGKGYPWLGGYCFKRFHKGKFITMSDSNRSDVYTGEAEIVWNYCKKAEVAKRHYFIF